MNLMMSMTMNTLYDALHVNVKVIRDLNIRVHSACADFCYDSENTHKLIPWRFLAIRRDVRQGLDRLTYKVLNKVAVDVNTEILKSMREELKDTEIKRYEALHPRRK